MALTVDARRLALVLIDLQKGILGMDVAPHRAADVLARAVGLARASADAGGLVVLVRVAFAADEADRLRQPVDAPMPPRAGGPPPDWAELAPELLAIPHLVVTKRQWGAFHGTELDTQLRRRGIDTVVLGGIATNMGVESTAREAWQHNYAVVIAEDATTGVDAAMHEFAVTRIFPRIARVRPSDEILAALRAGKASGTHAQ